MDISCFTPLWGNWEIDALIGQGSYGKVYRAKRTEFDKTYYSAVKHISVPSSQNEVDSLFADGVVNDARSLQAYYDNLLQRLMREIDINVSLKGHTNIVSYEDHMVIPRKDGPGFDVFIRMELLTPLPQLLQQRPITENEVRKLGADICSALEVMAKYNILHRDIKPSNIFVSSSGEYKIGDFGVSRTMDSAANGVTMAGTLNYMAPELNRGQNVSLKSDMYSLGLVLYRLCNANRAPFVPLPPAPATADMMEASNAARFSGRSLPAPAYASPELAAIILKTCDFYPENRFANASELKKALLGGPVPATPPRQDAPVQQKSKKWMIPVVAAGIAIVVLIAAIIFILANADRKKDSDTQNFYGQLTSDVEKAAASKTPQETPEASPANNCGLEESAADFVEISSGIGQTLDPDEPYYDVCLPQFVENSSGAAELNERILADFSYVINPDSYAGPMIEVISYELVRNGDVCAVVISETYAERNDSTVPSSTFHSPYNSYVTAYYFDEKTGECISGADYAAACGFSESEITDAYYSQFSVPNMRIDDIEFYIGNGGELVFGGYMDMVHNINASFHDYAVFRADYTWENANISAMNNGGHLATITSDDEFDTVIQLASASAAKYFWLGGHTADTGNGISAWWTTGENVPAKYWCAGEPSGSDNNVVEDCIMLWYLEQYGGWTLNDIMNDPIAYVNYYKNNLAYIVEYGDGYTGNERP